MTETILRSPAAEPADVRIQERFVRWACLGAVGILAIGLWAQMPYLAVEHGRLEPWRIVELWCADILALVWFGRFALEHAVLAEPLVAVPVDDARGQIRMVTLAGVIALLVELLLTFSLVLNERERYAQGTVTDGTPEMSAR